MDEDDDQLRSRLARIDPMSPAVSTDPPTSAHAQDLMETIMQTAADLPPNEQPPPRRRPLIWVAAAAAVIALAAGAYAIVDSGGSEDTVMPNDSAPPTGARAVTLAPPDITAICLAVDASVLAPSDLAYAGTVGEVTDRSVTVDVDHWYKGGDADVVTLEIAEGNDVALDGVAFESGGRYLVSATGTTVNACGLSGPATPEFEALYAEAFGG